MRDDIIQAWPIGLYRIGLCNPYLVVLESLCPRAYARKSRPMRNATPPVERHPGASSRG